MADWDSYIAKQERIMEKGKIEQKFQAEKNLGLAKKIKSNMFDLKNLSNQDLPIFNNFLQGKQTHPINESINPIYNKLKKYLQDYGDFPYINVLMMRMELRKLGREDYKRIKKTPVNYLKEEFSDKMQEYLESMKVLNSPLGSCH